jgi:hypothetical protein
MSKRFEGIQQMYFNEEQLKWINLTQKYGLIWRFTDKARKLYLARLLNQALNFLDISYNEALEDM